MILFSDLNICQILKYILLHTFFYLHFIMYYIHSFLPLWNRLACHVCRTLFSTRENHIKHKRFNKYCEGKVPAKIVNIIKATPHSGEKITIMLTSEKEVEFTGDPLSDDNDLVCWHCLYGFHNVSNMRAHHCVHEPSISPSNTVLKLLYKSRANEFWEGWQV
jgi:hypothetical protein